MQPNANTQDVFNLLNLSDEEKEIFLSDVGKTILESALLKFVLTLAEDEHDPFESFLANAGEGEQLLEALLETYPPFAGVLAEVIEEFRAEAVGILGSDAVSLPVGATDHQPEDEHERSGVHHE